MKGDTRKSLMMRVAIFKDVHRKVKMFLYIV